MCCVIFYHLPHLKRVAEKSLCQTNGPNANFVVGVTTEKGGAIGTPGKGDAVVLFGFWANHWKLWGKLSYNDLGFKVPDLDALLGGGAQPVSVGGEDKTVDDVVCFQTV